MTFEEATKECLDSGMDNFDVLLMKYAIALDKLGAKLDEPEETGT